MGGGDMADVGGGRRSRPIRIRDDSLYTKFVTRDAGEQRPPQGTERPRRQCRGRSHIASSRDEPYPAAASCVAGSTADLTVRMITAATLYGSASEAGRRSSRYPFQPLLTVPIGIRIDAPRSEMA